MRSSLAGLGCVLWTAVALAAPSPFPLRVAQDGRCLQDAAGNPFLYHADTAWLLFQKLTLDEADEYLATRRAQGFNAIQVMLTAVPGEATNRAGDPPFLGGNDFNQPNESYFAHIDQVLKRAEKHGLLLAMTPMWISCCRDGWAGKDDQERWLPMNVNGPEKCRELGRYYGRRYSGFPNVMWILGGDNDPGESRAVIEQLALGLKDTAPQQLRTYHPSSSHSSTDAWPGADWLDASMVYTYFRGFDRAWTKDMPDVYELSWREFAKGTRKPFFLGESTYEGEHGDWGSALQARKQAYWVMLGGGSGHAYGSPNWKCEPGWREGLQRPGALSLRHWHALFTSRPWWRLVPDTGSRMLVQGAGTPGTNDLATAAVADDASFAIAYLPGPRRVTVAVDTVRGKVVSATWFNPRSGTTQSAGEWTRRGSEPLPQPTLDPPGPEDWVLVLEDTGRHWPPLGTAGSPGPKPAAAASTELGWRALFDGTSTRGWRGFGQPAFPDKGWVVEDGILKKVRGVRGGDIVHEEEFEEFELTWEWRIPAKANNGVKYFILESRGAALGHEYQMVDDSTVGPGKHQTASFYDVLPPLTNTPPARIDGWNESRILVRGQHVEHWLNGFKALEYELGSPEVLGAVARSKFKDVDGFGKRLRGRILLTDHNDEAWFRNIRIRTPAP